MNLPMTSFDDFDYPRLRLSVALVAGLAVFFLLPFSLERRLLYAWNAAALALLSLSWWVIFSADPDYTRKSATRQDIGGRWVGLLVLLSSAISIVVVVVIFPRVQKEVSLERLLLSVAAIFASWLLVHTTYTFRYARKYYQEGEHQGALSFPEDEEPDFRDFAYFSLNMGMCFQVADIVPESRAMRRTVMGHALLSYVFGTGLVAVTINMLASVL